MSPFWSQLLLAPDRSATFVVLRLSGKDYRATVSGIDGVLKKHSRSDFNLGVSGVPYVAEHIRRELARELQRFSIAAFVVFGILVVILFRSVAVLVGTMVASLSAAFGTFIVRSLAELHTDILAPNLWTIAFVLTLSHVAYLATQWQRKKRELGHERAIEESIRIVGPGSAWSLIANLLGFASLIFVSAKPLAAIRHFRRDRGRARLALRFHSLSPFSALGTGARWPGQHDSTKSGAILYETTSDHRILHCDCDDCSGAILVSREHRPDIAFVFLRRRKYPRGPRGD